MSLGVVGQPELIPAPPTATARSGCSAWSAAGSAPAGRAGPEAFFWDPA